MKSTPTISPQLAQSFLHYLRWTPIALTHHFIGIDLALQSLGDPLLCRDSLSSSSYQRSTHSEQIIPSAMATTRSGSRLLLLAVALALVLFVGSADAHWQHCRKGFKSCNPHKPHPGCETCIDNDPHNCGDCGIVCKYGGECKYGKCIEPKCPTGYGNCDGKRWNGCETDLQNDPNNCGYCGTVCKYNGKCKYGKCVVPPRCPPGYGDCDGKPWNKCETDLRHDIYNCGTCGHKCPCDLKWGEPTCNWGHCGQQCKHGWNYDNVKKCCVKKW